MRSEELWREHKFYSDTSSVENWSFEEVHKQCGESEAAALISAFVTSQAGLLSDGGSSFLCRRAFIAQI